ncbi:MAG: cell division protein FtsQ/DivIB [Anaerolineales bacterium]
MSSIDRDGGHVRPKKISPAEETEASGHVRPAAGRRAAERRRRARRESRQLRPPINPATASEAAPQPMTVRPERVAQRKRKRYTPRHEGKPTERVRPRGVVWLSWRWVSAIISAVSLIILVLLLSSDAFYVRSVSVGGVNYLTREDVFRFSGTSQQHLFWLDANTIRRDLEQNNNIAAAEVRIGWPPNPVQILVQEREPAIVWEQNQDRVWVDVNGVVMFQREDRADLLRVVYDPNEPQPSTTIGPFTRIPPEVVQGALLLHSRLPSIDVLLYHPVKGLGWRDPRGWMAWFGVGDNMVMKAVVYEALVQRNLDDVQFGEVDVSDPDNPVYTVLWRRSEIQE